MTESRTPTLRVRLARVRDLLLLVVTAVCATLAAVLIWAGEFSPLADSLVDNRASRIGFTLAAVALVAGIAYVLTPPPCHADPGRRITST